MTGWLILAIRVTAACALALLAWLPADTVAAQPVTCLYRRFLGIACLGCGTTRAVSELLHGNIDQALALNPLCVPVVALAIFALTPWFTPPGRRS